MAALATRIWHSWRQTQACNRKVAGSIPPTRGPNWAPISGGGVLQEIGARFPAPCPGNWGPISGETAGQAALLETLGQHRVALTMCVRARGVNITRFLSKPSKYTSIYINILIYIHIYIYTHYIQHYLEFLFSAIHNPWSNATNLPVGGWQALACLNPAMHKASDAGHIEPHGMRRCLSFSYRGTAACRRPSPGGIKTAHFWRVLDVHKTSQISSKMALGRG